MTNVLSGDSGRSANTNNSSGRFWKERGTLGGLFACFTVGFAASADHHLRLTVQVPDNSSVTRSHPFLAAEDYEPEVEMRAGTRPCPTDKSDPCD